MKTFFFNFGFAALTKESKESQSKMGQASSKVASKRESRREFIYRTGVWMGIKTLEVEALQKSSTDTRKEIDKIRKQFLCQSILLKEAFDEQLRQQKNETEAVKREVVELKQRLKQLEFVFAATALFTETAVAQNPPGDIGVKTEVGITHYV